MPMFYEEWRDVIGYEGMYQVSSLGRVRSCLTTASKTRQTWHLLSLSRNGKESYAPMKVGLKRRGTHKNRTVHSLVLEAFVGPRPAGYEGSHLDGNPAHNYVTNLKWETPSENCMRKEEHGTLLRGRDNRGCAKLTEEQVLEIRRLDGTMPRTHIAKRFKIDPSNVKKICDRRSWRYLP